MCRLLFHVVVAIVLPTHRGKEECFNQIQVYIQKSYLNQQNESDRCETEDCRSVFQLKLCVFSINRPERFKIKWKVHK